MPTITITDVDIDREYRVFSTVDEGGVTHIWASVSYRALTLGGRELRETLTVELTGTPKTRAVALFNDIKDLAKAQEGV